MPFTRTNDRTNTTGPSFGFWTQLLSILRGWF